MTLVERLREAGNRIVNYNFGRGVAELLFEAADSLSVASVEPDSESFQRARAEKWLAAHEHTKLQLNEVQALVLALQAHAKEHGWQDYDEPIADLLAWDPETTPPRFTGEGPDVVCQHGTAADVHCCNCHSGFIFDRDHECPPKRPDARP